MTDLSPAPPPAPNKAVARALDVLDLFLSGPAALGVTEVAGHIGVDKSTASRIVATLLQRGYLERSEDGRRFEVGPNSWLLGLRYRPALLLGETARVAMTDVLRRFPGTIGYAGVVHHFHVYYVSVSDSPDAQRVHLELGERTPAALLGIGRAVLAHMPAEVVDAWLSGAVPPELPAHFSTRSAFLAELESIRRDGFAINEGDYDPQIAAVAAPVFDRARSPIGAIAIDLPARDGSAQRYAELGPAVVEAAGNVQRILATLRS